MNSVEKAVPGKVSLNALNVMRYREKQGVSLEAIAETTKISMRFLRAIEAREYDKLPGGIYGISYLRQYAAAIDFDELTLVGDYLGVIHPEPPPPSPERPKISSLLDRWLGLPAPERS